MIQRTFRYRLYPSREQGALMEATANARRFIYNLALEQRRDFWRQAKAAGITLNYVSQGRELTQLRREYEWLAAVSSTPLAQALRDLDKAFAAFFAGRARYPAFQSKHRQMRFRHNAVEVGVRQIGGKWAAVRLPKIGWVRMRDTRTMGGKIVSVTLTRDALGWHVCFACEIEHEAPANDLPAVGIDRGIANTLALSSGELLSTPDTDVLERRKRKAQRILSRRRRGSNRRRKQLQCVARIAAKIARVRADWQHRTGTDIARRFGTVALEDLRIPNMVRANRGLARSIHEQGCGALVKVNPAYTSQECSACGVIDKRSRENQARFACRHCGFAGHADTNAATNILRRSSPVVEGAGYGPVEARTNHALAA